TNVFSTLMRGDPVPVERFLRLTPGEVLVPHPVLAEIRYGLSRLPRSKRRGAAPRRPDPGWTTRPAGGPPPDRRPGPRRRRRDLTQVWTTRPVPHIGQSRGGASLVNLGGVAARGPNLTGIDPDTGAVVLLFHPGGGSRVSSARRAGVPSPTPR